MHRLTGRFLVACIAAAVLAVSFLWSPSTLPRVELCYFHKLTGMPCPGCGLTRGFCAISHGGFAEAWAFNPFSFVLYIVAIALLVRPLVARVMPRVEAGLYQRRTLCLIPAVVCALWLFGIVRLMRLA